jgi:Zn-dependent protease with chaperone function
MNWWAHQDSARARTRRLVIMMISAVLATTLMIYVVLLTFRLIFHVFLIIHAFVSNSDKGSATTLGVADALWWPFGFWCALGFMVIVTGLSAFIEYRRLRKGNGFMLSRLGGRRIDEAPAGYQEQQLVNVVHEMAIASRAPMPSVYVLEAEPGINAVSIGFKRENSAIALTRGALDGLSREQIQAVVAHEMAHILNGDTRVNMIAISLVCGLGGVFFVGLWIMFPEEGEGSFFLGLPVASVGLLGVLAAWFIQVRICRQREYLADACAVQYTRYAPALAEALRSIESNPGKSWMKHAASHELAHMFFADTKRRWLPLFRTHPKTTQRIGRIEPTHGR